MHLRPFPKRSRVHCFSPGPRKDHLAVIPKICDLCGAQGSEKLVSLYWAWVRADGHRKAYKQRVCPECMRQRYVPLIVRAMEPVLICPACGESTAEDMDAIYLTFCIPGMPQDASEMPTCGSCAVEIRNLALTGAVPLEDRGVGVGGLQPVATSAAQGWADLGIVPRERGR